MKYLCQIFSLLNLFAEEDRTALLSLSVTYFINSEILTLFSIFSHHSNNEAAVCLAFFATDDEVLNESSSKISFSTLNSISVLLQPVRAKPTSGFKFYLFCYSLTSWSTSIIRSRVLHLVLQCSLSAFIRMLFQHWLCVNRWQIPGISNPGWYYNIYGTGLTFDDQMKTGGLSVIQDVKTTTVPAF